MQPTWWQRMDMFARKRVPFGLTLLLMLFALTPTQVPGLGHVTPMYALAAVYFWSIYRPDLIGYGTAFGIGLLQDLLTEAPLGSSALILMLCQYLVFQQPKFFNAKPFGVFWLAFAMVAFGAGLLKWLCVGIVTSAGFTSFGDMFVSVILTVALYPMIAWMLAKAQIRLLAQT